MQVGLPNHTYPGKNPNPGGKTQPVGRVADRIGLSRRKRNHGSPSSAHGAGWRQGVQLVVGGEEASGMGDVEEKVARRACKEATAEGGDGWRRPD